VTLLGSRLGARSCLLVGKITIRVNGTTKPSSAAAIAVIGSRLTKPRSTDHTADDGEGGLHDRGACVTRTELAHRELLATRHPRRMLNELM